MFDKEKLTQHRKNHQEDKYLENILQIQTKPFSNIAEYFQC